MFPRWKKGGYRVAQGGHDIPEVVIQRWFQTGLENFLSLYKPLADAWRHYDNAGEEPSLMFRSLKSEVSRWNK